MDQAERADIFDAKSMTEEQRICFLVVDDSVMKRLDKPEFVALVEAAVSHNSSARKPCEHSLTCPSLKTRRTRTSQRLLFGMEVIRVLVG